MKLINKNTRKSGSILFLGIFILFLVLSVSHSHNYNINYNSSESLSSPKKNNSQDVFLDSSSNCIIHSLVNSLKVDSVFILSDNIKNTDTYITVPLNQFYTNKLSELTHLLRAPPILFS